MQYGPTRSPRTAHWWLSLSVWSLSSCAAIFGVEEAQCSKQGCPGVKAGPSEAGISDASGEPKDKDALCNEYCKAVTNRCDERLPQYKNEAGCELVCKGVLETAAEVKGANTNTIECRLAEAVTSIETADAGFADSCVAAGLMGTNCGGECENYCSFMQTFCPKDYAELDNCIDTCASVPRSSEPYSNDLPYADHLECRLAHIQLAALDTANRTLHCGHAAGKPGPCETVVDKATLCEQYCAEVTQDCADKLPQYKNEEGCNLLCNALLLAASDTDTENTIQCRADKAKLANLVSDGFAENCVSAGPIGTYCGGACENYCYLMETHCEDAYAGLGDCMATCEDVPRSTEPYSVDLPYADSLECRFAHIQLATVDPAARAMHCGHAAGGPGPCEKKTE